MLLGPYSEYARAGQLKMAVLPDAAAGAHKHGEGLLASPELKRLQQCGLRQLRGIQRIAHLGHELPNLPPGEEAVLACEQEAGRQEVLQSQVYIDILAAFAISSLSSSSHVHAALEGCPTTMCDVELDAERHLSGSDKDLARFGGAQVVHDTH